MASMDADDLRSLSRVLNFGTANTRRAVALRMAADHNAELPHLLMDTARSEESSEVRDRCLEILGIMAEAGDREAFQLLAELGIST